MALGEITWTGLVILVGVALGAGVSLWLAAVATRRDAPVARTFRWLNLVCAMVCVALIALYLSPTLPLAFVAHVTYLGSILGTAVVFVLFVIVYTGNRHWLTPRRVGLLVVEPAVYVLLVATNPFHGLMLADVHTVQFEGLTTMQGQATVLSNLQFLYTLLLTTAGYALLARFYLRTRNIYRKQTGLIFLGGLLIPICAFLYSGDVTPIDLTPFALVVNSIVVWIALFRYDFLDVTPLAADLLIEEMEDAVLVTGRQGEILDANGAAERLFVSARDGSVQGSKSTGALVGRSLLAVSPSLAEAVDGGDLFVHTVGEGDHSLKLDPSVTSIHDQFGIRRGTLLVLRDITEQVRRQAELERQNERLDEFTSVVSHDLRNPLSVVEGYVDLAREEDDTAHLDRAVNAIDRMNALIEDLLTLAREGQSVDEVERVPLASVVDAAWQNVDSGEEATLVNETEGSVKADAKRLQQLFENLFRNAVEHAGPDVVIRVGREDGGFYVEDDGPGVPATARERVFERGYSSLSSGTGFGLAIVQTIAQAHGWSVRLVEGRNGGARFEFTGVGSHLPLVSRVDST